jgi:hypothetical protein
MSANPRLQRTRSAPLRSPLSFKPLGGFKPLLGAVPLALFCACLAGCESFNGRLYWAGKAPGFLVEQHCEPIQPGSGAFVRVNAHDWQGAILPGVMVRFRGSRPGSALEFQTDEHGLVNAWIGPGAWRLDASLRGFRSGRLELHLSKDQACTVKFQLRLSNKQEFFVASGEVDSRE